MVKRRTKTTTWTGKEEAGRYREEPVSDQVLSVHGYRKGWNRGAKCDDFIPCSCHEQWVQWLGKGWLMSHSEYTFIMSWTTAFWAGNPLSWQGAWKGRLLAHLRLQRWVPKSCGQSSITTHLLSANMIDDHPFFLILRFSEILLWMRREVDAAAVSRASFMPSKLTVSRVPGNNVSRTEYPKSIWV